MMILVKVTKISSRNDSNLKVLENIQSYNFCECFKSHDYDDYSVHEVYNIVESVCVYRLAIGDSTSVIYSFSDEVYDNVTNQSL